MGQALQKTHQYGKAINYYREAVKNQDHSRLRYDLAELLMKLKTYEKAEKAIKEALNEEAKSNDLTSLISQAKFITLLATVHEKNGDLQAATNSLNEAKQVRAKILKRVQVEQPDAVLEHRELTAKICHQVAEQFINQRDFDSAIQHYKEALTFHPDDDDALCALAKLYLMTDDLGALHLL